LFNEAMPFRLARHCNAQQEFKEYMSAEEEENKKTKVLKQQNNEQPPPHTQTDQQKKRNQTQDLRRSRENRSQRRPKEGAKPNANSKILLH
jgi:hypothetical protein